MTKRKIRTAHCPKHGKVKLPHPCGHELLPQSDGGVLIFGTKLIAGAAQRSAAAWKEAAASVSLDGETQFCDACVAEQHGLPKHTCGRREITQAEAELIEAALLFVRRHTDGRKCTIELDPLNCGSTEMLIDAAKAVRSDRSRVKP